LGESGFVHTYPGVGRAEHHVTARQVHLPRASAWSSCGDGDVPAVWHGVPRVHGEI
jgi:hypothetical protein